MFNLGVILAALTDTESDGLARARQHIITEAAVNSRQAIPGSLFVALPGERHDGHDFVADAFQRGALYALVQRDLSAQYPTLDLRSSSVIASDLYSSPAKQSPPVIASDLYSSPAKQSLSTAYSLLSTDSPLCLLVDDTLQALQRIAAHWRSLLNLKVIGVTGSVGKSTTKEVLAEVLAQRYRTFKTAGNLNNEIGLPLMLLSLSEGHQRAVLEMGFYVPGEIALLCQLARPEIGVVTNIGTVHAARAGDQQTIARGKAELVQSLPPHGVAVLNYDDPWARAMAEQTPARVFFYGLDPAAELWADQIEGLGLEGIRFRLHYHNEELTLRAPMIGRHSVHTALRAAAVALADGMDWAEIASGLRSSPTQLRLMAVRTESGALILDDTYNASPESVLADLNLLDEIPDIRGRKIAVLGDMLELGPYEAIGHHKVGLRAAEVADVLLTLGERARMIAEAANQAGLPLSRIREFTRIEDLLAHLQAELQPGDAVLVKGSRGMRMERITAALESPPLPTGSQGASPLTKGGQGGYP